MHIMSCESPEEKQVQATLQTQKMRSETALSRGGTTFLTGWFERFGEFKIFMCSPKTQSTQLS